MPHLRRLRSRRGIRQLRNRRPRRSLALETLEVRELLAGDASVDIAPLSDEFDDSSTLAAWQRVHQTENWNADQLQIWDVDQTQPGRMVMQPHTSVWYQNWRGPLAYKEVTGDFVFTSELHIGDRDDVGGSDADEIPNDAQFSLGGLMVRTPRSITDPVADWQPGSMQDDGTNDGENYVFLSLGHGVDGQMSFEVKTTRNSHSQLELTSVPPGAQSATLRIARVGSALITLYQLPGQDWTVHRRYDRPDMPETLQLGLVTYTDWSKAGDFDAFFHNSHVLQPGVQDPSPHEPFNPDLVAGFEYARFARPQLPAELAGVDLVHGATDQQLLSFLGDATPDPDPDPDPEPGRVMGIGVNLETNVDYSPAWVFKDAFHRARPWSALAHNPLTGESRWQFLAGNGPQLQVDDQGWIRELPNWTAEDGTVYEQRATTVVFTGDARQPAGIYRAEWTGNGELVMPFVVERGQTADGRHYALVDMPAGAHFDMTIQTTDPANPIRDIDLWMPDYEGQDMLLGDWQLGDAESPFHPLFVERLRGFDTLRFMDWQRTNYSDVVTWDDRGKLDDASQADSENPGYYDYANDGVALEYMIALANEVGADPWFNMPHQADDDFVRQFATLVRDALDPNLQVYVEWSNELWNGIFPVHSWLWEQAGRPEYQGLGFFEIAGREIRRDFDIWSDVFAGQEDRLVRVVAGQQSNSWVLDQLLAATGGAFDAVSATAYADLWDVAASQADANTTPDDLINSLLEVSIPWARDRLVEHRRIADRYEQQLGREIDLVTYESGSHIFAYGSPLVNSAAVDAAVEAMYSPRMYDVYQTLLNTARDAGVDLYNEFTFTGHYGASPFGTYGLLHSMDQPLEEAHQLRALLDFAAAQRAAAPTVSVRVEQPSLAEDSTALVQFIVQRGEQSLDQPLTVSYAIGGTAVESVDYTGLPGSVTFAAGETTATIVASLIDDTLVEGSETILLTLQTDPAYHVGPSSQAIVIVTDNDFASIGDQVMGKNDGQLVIDLPATHPDGTPLEYTVELVDELAREMDGQHGLFALGRYFRNWGGRDEIWLRGNNGWYFLLPDGQLGQWEGSFEQSVHLAQLTPRYHQQPELLHDAQPRGSARLEGAALIVEPVAGLIGDLELRVTKSNGHASETELVTVSVVNQAPTLQPIEDQVLVPGGDPVTIALLASDDDGDALTFEVEVEPTLAYELDQRFDFRSAGNYCTNWGGHQEKWIRGKQGAWFYLLPTGELYRWGGSFADSTRLAQLDEAHYHDPRLLTDAQPVPLAAELNGNLLTLRAGTGFRGSWRVSVVVSDGSVSTRRSFAVSASTA